MKDKELMKKCSQCGSEKELELFNKDKSSKDGYRCNCKECSKRYRDENKEKSKEYRIRNSESRREFDKNRKYDPIKKKEYYLLNKERILKNLRDNYNTDPNKKVSVSEGIPEKQ